MNKTLFKKTILLVAEILIDVALNFVIDFILSLLGITPANILVWVVCKKLIKPFKEEIKRMLMNRLRHLLGEEPFYWYRTMLVNVLC